MTFDIEAVKWSADHFKSIWEQKFNPEKYVSHEGI